MPQAIVLTIDGLGAKHLGPYGNTWIDTPAFNRLASESLLYENVYAPYDDSYRSLSELLQARSLSQPRTAEPEHGDLLSWLDAEGIRTTALTDDANFLDRGLAAGFAEQLDFIAAPQVLGLADEWDETHSANFFAQAVRAIDLMPDDGLLWLHTRGLGNPWDAPYDYRNQFADEDDPAPTGSAQVPMLSLDADYDPDTLHEIRCALAGQVTLIDQCLGVLLTVLGEKDSRADTLFVVTSPRGFPLGEHLHVGWKVPMVYPEMLHVPGFVRYPDGRAALRRTAGIGELRDITAAIIPWFAAREMPALDACRKCSISLSSAVSLLRTPAWHVKIPNDDAEISISELYLKPDDQNEINNVASRCADVVETGRRCLNHLIDRSDGSPDSILDSDDFQILFEPPA